MNSKDKLVLIKMLEGFQKRYSDAQLQIRKIEVEIVKLARTEGHDKSQIKELKLRMDALMNREKAWITQIKKMTLSLKKKVG